MHTGLQQSGSSILAQENAAWPYPFDSGVKDPLPLDEVLTNPSLPSIPMSPTPQLGVGNGRENPSYTKLVRQSKFPYRTII
jgi:hypothetical protein